MPPAAPATPSPPHWRRRDALVVALLLLATTVVGLLLLAHLSVSSAAMLYIVAVVIASYTVSLPASLACAFASAVLLNYFFVAPQFSFRIAAQENLTSLLAMLAVSFVISQRGTALRRETAAAHLGESRARELQELAMTLAGVEAREPVRARGEAMLRCALGQESRLFLRDDDGPDRLQPDPGPPLRERLLACMAQGAPLPPDAHAAPEGSGWSVPLVAEGHVLGAALLPHAACADPRTREHGQAICSLIAQALWRLQLAADSRAAEQKSQWHLAQSTFLAGISHDFRTPLAAIVTAASSLQTQRDRLDDAEQERLIRIVLDEAAHLSTLTENTLNLARLQDASELQRDWQSMEEIVGSVLARVRQREGGQRIHARVPAGLPLIHADPVLLAQLLENLLDNALKYSRDAIELEVATADAWLEVAVHDRGEGVRPGQEEAIFDAYRRADRSGQRGAGLGLAVCRAIARAHGGDVQVQARAGGGSTFTLRLPVAPAPALPAA